MRSEGGGPPDGIRAFIRQDTRVLSLSGSHCEDTAVHMQEAAVYMPGIELIQEPAYAGTSDLTLPVSRNVRKSISAV